MIKLAGTVAINNAAGTAAGTGSGYIGSIFSGDSISVDREHWYRITADASSDTALAFEPVFAEANVSGVTLWLMPVALTRTTNVGWSVGVTELLQRQREAFTLAGADRRLTLNKTAAGDLSEILFQQGGTSHGRIGLLGDNIFAIQQYINAGSPTDLIRAVVTGTSPNQTLGLALAPIGSSLTIFDPATYAAGVGGILNLALKSDTGVQRTGVRLEAVGTTGTNGAENVDAVLSTIRAGVLTEALRVTAAGLISAAGLVAFSNTTEASALGTAAVVLNGGLSVAKTIISGRVVTTGSLSGLQLNTRTDDSPSNLIYSPTPGLISFYNLLNDHIPLKLTAADSVVLGHAAIATNATDGMVYFPTCSGTPTGTPTPQTGHVAAQFDDTGQILWLYLGGSWKQPKTPAGAAVVTWQ